MASTSRCPTQGLFLLPSDSVMQTFVRWPRLEPITRQVSDADLKSEASAIRRAVS